MNTCNTEDLEGSDVIVLDDVIMDAGHYIVKLNSTE
jgi:hypoxanthine-guanine phosphoribosyltransferase